MTDSVQLGFEALDRTAAIAEHKALIEKLVWIAQGLASVRAEGVTIADVRGEAERQQLLPKDAKGRKLSFLGAVMKRAQLIPTEEFRRSEIDKSHGNLHRVWRRA